MSACCVCFTVRSKLQHSTLMLTLTLTLTYHWERRGEKNPEATCLIFIVLLYFILCHEERDNTCHIVTLCTSRDTDVPSDFMLPLWCVLGTQSYHWCSGYALCCYIVVRFRHKHHLFMGKRNVLWLKVPSPGATLPVGHTHCLCHTPSRKGSDRSLIAAMFGA